MKEVPFGNNTTRMHSSLGYQSLTKLEREFKRNTKAANDESIYHYSPCARLMKRATKLLNEKSLETALRDAMPKTCFEQNAQYTKKLQLPWHKRSFFMLASERATLFGSQCPDCRKSVSRRKNKTKDETRLYIQAERWCECGDSLPAKIFRSHLVQSESCAIFSLLGDLY